MTRLKPTPVTVSVEGAPLPVEGVAGASRLGSRWLTITVTLGVIGSPVESESWIDDAVTVSTVSENLKKEFTQPSR